MGRLKGRRVVVTGAKGYLGSRLCTEIHRLGGVVVPLSISAASGDSAYLSGKSHNPWRDVLESGDLVIHLAAQTDVPVAESDLIRDWTANVQPVLTALECARRSQRPIDVLLAGTATSVGLTDRLPVGEDQPDAPVTAYDLHKLIAEQYLNYFVRTGTVRGGTLRLSNVYGPGGEKSSPTRGVVNAMIRAAIRGEDLRVFGSGDYVRDYVFIDDVISAFIAAADAVDRLGGRYFFVGSGVGCTIADMAATVARIVGLRTGHEVKVVFVEPPPASSPIEWRSFVADTSTFRSVTGWKPQVTTLERGVSLTVDSILGCS